MTKHTKLLDEITKEMKANSDNYWRMDWSTAQMIANNLTPAEANQFMIDLLPKLGKDNWADAMQRFLGDDTIAPFRKLVDAETLNEFVDCIFDNEKLKDLGILKSLVGFDNLSLDTIKTIMDWECNCDYCLKPDTDNADNSKHRSVGNIKESIVEHKSIPQEYLDTLASERAVGYLHKIAELTKNPKTLLKCVLVASRSDGDYYTVSHALDNEIITVEMLEEMAEFDDNIAAAVLGCRKCPKALIAKIALTARGEAAKAILQAGKTEPAVLEALVDSNDDPEVLIGIAYNRSKKVPASALLKAFSKIPDNNFWYKQKFLKRGDMGRVLADLARKATGCQPALEVTEEEVA